MARVTAPARRAGLTRPPSGRFPQDLVGDRQVGHRPPRPSVFHPPTAPAAWPERPACPHTPYPSGNTPAPTTPNPPQTPATDCPCAKATSASRNSPIIYPGPRRRRATTPPFPHPHPHTQSRPTPKGQVNWRAPQPHRGCSSLTGLPRTRAPATHPRAHQPGRAGLAWPRRYPPAPSPGPAAPGREQPHPRELQRQTAATGYTDREILYTPREAQVLIEGWRQTSNQLRPHNPLRYRPPPPQTTTPTPTRPPTPQPTTTPNNTHTTPPTPRARHKHQGRPRTSKHATVRVS